MAKLEEDEGAERGFNVVPNEGEDDKPFVMPSTLQMSNPEMWVYAKPNILKNGRTTHLPPEEPANMPEGEEFDPSLHEAVQHEGDGSNPVIGHVMRKGYRFGDQVLRHALVGVVDTVGSHENAESDQ